MKHRRPRSDDRLVATLPKAFRPLWSNYKEILLYSFSGDSFDDNRLYNYEKFSDGYAVAEIDYVDGLRGFIFRGERPLAAYTEFLQDGSLISNFLIKNLEDGEEMEITALVTDRTRVMRILIEYKNSVQQ